MRKALMLATALAAIALTPSTARAVPINIAGTGSTGASFTGTFDYDATTTTVTVSLTNSSPLSLGGFLTGFVFNIPNAADVTAVAQTQPNVSPKAAFQLLGEADFDNIENAAPYGKFDIGSALGNAFLGGGSPNDGIPVGGSGIWTFRLTGTGLGGLASQDFLNTLSVPTGRNSGEDFVVRFKGLTPKEGSDKVPNSGGTPVPEPGTAMLVGLGLASLAARRRARSR